MGPTRGRRLDRKTRAAAALMAPVAALGLWLAGCESELSLLGPGGPSIGFAVAYDRWAPGPHDTCSPEIHNSYSVIGPDQKTYPTWHPPVDPVTGCTFGHEHGRDPRGSALYELVGDIPFGYANEQLDIWDPSTARHEDHVGHKIEWENDVAFSFGSGAANSVLELRCDVLMKLHQGTHSKDAFTNNLHELAHHARCTDGTRIHITLLTPIGTPGEFISTCDREKVIAVGTATPPNSPEGGGKRLIPDRECVERLLVPDGERSRLNEIRESWQISDRVRSADGRTLVSFNPYFQVFLPARFFDPTGPDGVGRVVDLCFVEGPNGERVRDDRCEQATANGTLGALPYDDPRSPFDGAHRFVDINSIRIRNAEGPAIWYSDPFGENARTERFPGSVRQFVATIDNDRGPINPSGPNMGRDRDYGAGGVHAPN